jgi:hypothetical protein
VVLRISPRKAARAAVKTAQRLRIDIMSDVPFGEEANFHTEFCRL